MAYDPTDIDTSTETGRVNAVRLLVGDTSTTEALTDDEILFFLSLANDRVYSAAYYAAYSLGAKYSYLVDTELEGILKESYSDRSKNYFSLAKQLKAQSAAMSMSAKGGGISISEMYANWLKPDRVKPKFYVDQFANIYSISSDEDKNQWP
jgi:hypothetical protein